MMLLLWLKSLECWLTWLLAVAGEELFSRKWLCPVYDWHVVSVCLNCCNKIP